MIRLNVEFIQQQIDDLRIAQQDRALPYPRSIVRMATSLFGGKLPEEDEPYALAGLAGKKRTRRPAKFDLWSPRKTVVEMKAGGTVTASYPYYLTYLDERIPNRAQRRAAAADDRHRTRGRRRREAQRRLAARDRSARLTRRG